MLAWWTSSLQLFTGDLWSAYTTAFVVDAFPSSHGLLGVQKTRSRMVW